MSTEENKAIARRFFEEVWTKGNLSVADEVLDPNVILHDPRNPADDTIGREAYKQFNVSFRSAFPDMTDTIEELIAEGDKVVVRWTIRATHRGQWQSMAPSGKQLTFGGITILRIVGGKIVDDRFQADLLGFMQQIGAIPSPSESGD